MFSFMSNRTHQHQQFVQNTYQNVQKHISETFEMIFLSTQPNYQNGY